MRTPDLTWWQWAYVIALLGVGLVVVVFLARANNERKRLRWWRENIRKQAEREAKERKDGASLLIARAVSDATDQVRLSRYATPGYRGALRRPKVEVVK